jgi:hypothetical protein
VTGQGAGWAGQQRGGGTSGWREGSKVRICDCESRSSAPVRVRGTGIICSTDTPVFHTDQEEGASRHSYLQGYRIRKSRAPLSIE